MVILGFTALGLPHSIYANQPPHKLLRIKNHSKALLQMHIFIWMQAVLLNGTSCCTNSVLEVLFRVIVSNPGVFLPHSPTAMNGAHGGDPWSPWRSARRPMAIPCFDPCPHLRNCQSLHFTNPRTCTLNVYIYIYICHAQHSTIYAYHGIHGMTLTLLKFILYRLPPKPSKGKCWVGPNFVTTPRVRPFLVTSQLRACHNSYTW